MEWNGSLVINWDERAGVFPDGLVSDAFSSFEQTLRSLASSKATWEETRIVHLPQKQKLVRIAANDTEYPPLRLYEDSPLSSRAPRRAIGR